MTIDPDQSKKGRDYSMTGYRTVWSAAAAVIAAGTAAAACIRSIPEVKLPDTYGSESAMQFKAAADPETIAEAVQKAPDTAYLLKLDGDMLCIYAEGSRTPAAEYELPAGWLPDYDRILLEYGLRVNNAKELRQLLEDYIS